MNINDCVQGVATYSQTDTKIVLNSPNLSLDQQLILALKHEDLTQIEELVSAGESASSYQGEMCQMVLTNLILSGACSGASVDLQDEEGRSSIFLATENQQFGAVELLIKLGEVLCLDTLLKQIWLLSSLPNFTGKLDLPCGILGFSAIGISMLDHQSIWSWSVFTFGIGSSTF